jgi:hypothetical protein
VTIVLAQQQDQVRLREVFLGRLAAATELGDPWEQFYVRVGLLSVLSASNPSRAIAKGEESFRLARQLANPSMVAYATMLLAPFITSLDPNRAEALLEEAIGIFSAMRNDFAGIRARQNLGSARAARGEHLPGADTYLSAAELASQVGARLSVFEAVGALACDLAELGEHEAALLLATWAGSQGHWPKDWANFTHFTFPDSPTLARVHAEMPPEQRPQLDGQAEAIDDAEAIALARASLEALSRTDL